MRSHIFLDATEAFRQKLDIYFRLHILPQFDPTYIHWWFSLSGGKDSFAMVEGVREWYAKYKFKLTCSTFVIDQWGGTAPESTSSQIDWQSVNVIDGRTLTQAMTKYIPGQQAPCRACADARRLLTAALVSHADMKPGFVNLVARGLHLSDTATSLAWRFALGRDASAEMISLGKAKPISSLAPAVYLAKPLSYIREFETEQYAKNRGYRSACCGCPACKYPSRRDIVEETILKAYDSDLWEFTVPGMSQLLEHFGAVNLKAFSAPGRVQKRKHLPHDFPTFVVERFRRICEQSRINWERLCDSGADLDQLGLARICGAPLVADVNVVPLPAILRNRPLEPIEELMIATMGPFWGAIALSPLVGNYAWTLQKDYFQFVHDERWSQVNILLNDYYTERREYKPTSRVIFLSSKTTAPMPRSSSVEVP